MELSTERNGGALVIRVDAPRIDAAGAIQFNEAIRRATEGSDLRVILDLSQVHFLDSSGLGALVSVMKLLAPARRLELACLAPAVEKVFRLTRMDAVFTIHPVVPDAGELRHAG